MINFFQKLQVFPITRRPTSPPTLANKDQFIETRVPSRQELLLKMSEEKQKERLQKERAKLLEATFMTSENNKNEKDESEKQNTNKDPLRTRLRVPLRRKRKNRNEIKDDKDESPINPITPFQVLRGFLIFNHLN